MKLKDYLKVFNITAKAFSNKLGISEVSISRYIKGSRFPNKSILDKIQLYTEGAVTADDFKCQPENFYNSSSNEIYEIKSLVKKIKNGSRSHLAKAITMIESFLYEDQKKSEILISHLKEKKNSIRIGISGVPGVGKSTFIEVLGLYLIKKGFRVAVLAIDPSSEVSGGSILGDKTRMEKLSIDNNAFVRPSPNKGHLGGVSRKTRESMMCFESADYDIIFIETMGVGQAETAVYKMVDIFLVLLLPSGGDDLQGIKKGIIELADILVINKADTTLKEDAENTLVDYKNALSIIKPVREDFEPVVLKCSALNNSGISQIWKYIKRFVNKRRKNRTFQKNRAKQNNDWMWELIFQKVNTHIENEIKEKKMSKQITNKMEEHRINVVKAANLLLTSFIKKI